MINITKMMQRTSGYKPHLSHLEKVVCRVMKCGEGSAISNAGTARVSSVLRKSSRIIKNSI